MRRDWEGNGIVVVVVASAAEVSNVVGIAGKELGTAVFAAVKDSFSGRSKVLEIVLRLRRSNDVGSAL